MKCIHLSGMTTLPSDEGSVRATRQFVLVTQGNTNPYCLMRTGTVLSNRNSIARVALRLPVDETPMESCPNRETGNESTAMSNECAVNGRFGVRGELYRGPCVTVKIVTALAKIVSHTRISLVVVMRVAFFTDSKS